MAVLRSVRIVVEAERSVVSEGVGSNTLSVGGGEVGFETRRRSPYILLKAWALLFLALA